MRRVGATVAAVQQYMYGTGYGLSVNKSSSSSRRNKAPASYFPTAEEIEKVWPEVRIEPPPPSPPEANKHLLHILIVICR